MLDKLFVPWKIAENHPYRFALFKQGKNAIGKQLCAGIAPLFFANGIFAKKREILCVFYTTVCDWMPSVPSR